MSSSSDKLHFLENRKRKKFEILEHLTNISLWFDCRTAIEKFGCFTEELNRGRPLLYACRPSDIIDVLMGQFGDEADSINLSFDIETCSGKTEKCTTLLPNFILLTCTSPVISMCIQTDWGSTVTQ